MKDKECIMTTTTQLNFEKQKIAIEHILKGLMYSDRRYAKVLRAFEIAKTYHSGTRKDGKTPEFKHQLNIIGCILNYSNLLADPINTLIAALLHDVVEDYSGGSKVWDSERDRVRLKGLPFYDSESLRREFGDEVVSTNNALSKVINGNKKDLSAYYRDMTKDRSALIVKAEDRDDNLKSMFQVFTLQKQMEYANDVHTYFIPALKEGEKNFPEQSFIYQMLKTRLKEKANSVLEVVESYRRIGFDLTLTIEENIEALGKKK